MKNRFQFDTKVPFKLLACYDYRIWVLNVNFKLQNEFVNQDFKP
jgi:hypothetical protein